MTFLQIHQDPLLKKNLILENENYFNKLLYSLWHLLKQKVMCIKAMFQCIFNELYVCIIIVHL